MMPSWFQILIVVLLAVLLFGRGKISSLMGDVAKGITAFKKGMKDGAEEETAAQRDSLKDEKVIDVSASTSSHAKERYEG